MIWNSSETNMLAGKLLEAGQVITFRKLCFTFSRPQGLSSKNRALFWTSYTSQGCAVPSCESQVFLLLISCYKARLISMVKCLAFRRTLWCFTATCSRFEVLEMPITVYDLHHAFGVSIPLMELLLLGNITGLEIGSKCHLRVFFMKIFVHLQADTNKEDGAKMKDREFRVSTGHVIVLRHWGKTFKDHNQQPLLQLKRC